MMPSPLVSSTLFADLYRPIEAVGTIAVDGFDGVDVPPGGVPCAVAVFWIWPAFTSASVTVYASETQVVVAPAASEVASQVTVSPSLLSIGSSTPTVARATLPVFDSSKCQVTLSPTCAAAWWVGSALVAYLLSTSFGAGGTSGVSVGDFGETTGVVAPGGVPCAVATLATLPAFSSAAVIVYAPLVQVVAAAGARVVTGQVTATPAAFSIASSTAMPPSVTLPVLVTTKDQVMVSPALVRPSAVVSTTCLTDFTSVRSGAEVPGNLTSDGGVVTGVVLPFGVPVAVAVLVITPASTSAWTTV